MLMKVRMRCPECMFQQDIDVDEAVDLGFIPEIAKSSMRCLCLNKTPKIYGNTSLDASMVSINGVSMRELKILTMPTGVFNGHSD